MMKSIQSIGFCVAALLLATTVNAAKPTTTTVTSQLLVPADSAAPVFFCDAVTPVTCETAKYVETAGTTPVGSRFLSSGDWQLDAQSTARAVGLDLGGGSPFTPLQSVHSLLTTHCAATNGTPVALLTGVTSTTTCGMSFRINSGTDSSVFYRIHFNSVSYIGTGNVKFTCNSVASNNSCVDWTARPADDDQTPLDGRSTGMLVKVTSARGKEIETLVGYYQISFQVHITKP